MILLKKNSCVRIVSIWRMPTLEEAEKLVKECYWQYVTSYSGKNVKGYIVYKVKNDADKGKVTNLIIVYQSVPYVHSPFPKGKIKETKSRDVLPRLLL